MAFTVDRSKFDAVLAELVENVKEHFASKGASHEVITHVEKCFYENSTNGKMLRGLSVPQTGLSTLNLPITEQEFHDLCILGWLVESLQAYLLMHDDIMDNSSTRRGKPCWYRRASVGMKAVNDGDILKSSIFFLLKLHFQKYPAYLKIMETFHEFAFLTEIGQECDGIASDNRSTEQWNMAEYDTICELKGGYYGFYLSVLLALQYLQLDTPNNIQQTRDILVPLGSFYQFQNEYLDIFGNHRLTGKIGTDIQENKCSWVIIQALRMCSTEQRHILLENYGQPSRDSAMECQRIFELLPLREEYRLREDRVFGRLEASVCKLDESEGLGKGIFGILFDSVRGVTRQQVPH
ncbi:farnesyl-pyrophosphate synthetase [Aspergillus costaricaensis CBS 115574]|uniref:Farnesyl-pyrophosphate synthetase n=1 Tax=Aspergillus costaricaensis CBS 115574 TaxID=1448317 RepID=A0ACD1IN72_9EURO|nr:farnesyl-pyrophosphate synthetase [Aspergillus costaricaensis CBS 115574]RAK91857.1 farnesyl-pyrophosphate synthetase [Aspergillus costaricaensis CBS 115574]